MARIELSNIGGGGGGGSTTLALTTTGTSGASALTTVPGGYSLNIPVYQGALSLSTAGTSGASTLVGDTLTIPTYQGQISLTTTGTSGASTFVGNTLNIPTYQGAISLTTTGTSGAATLVGNTLNVPQYSTAPAGSTGQIQYNNAGAFGASANLAWDNAATQLNIGAPSAPTGKFNVKGSGTLSSTVNLRLTNSGNTELFKVLDNGTTNIGSSFVFNNSNAKLSIGGIAESATIGAVGDLQSSSPGIEILRTGVSSANAFFRVITSTGTAGEFGPLFTMKSNTISGYGGGFNIDCAVDNSLYGPIAVFTARASNGMVSNRAMFDFCNFAPSGVSTGKTVMRIHANSNISIQDGGTPSTSGYRLDINASGASAGGVITKGPGISSTTYSLICTNSGASTTTAALAVRDDSKVGIGTNSIDSGATLEVDGTSGGILFPRLTTTQRDALTPTNGLMIYNTTTSKFQGYAGGAWVDLH